MLRVLPPSFKPVNNQFYVGVNTRNIAIQLALQQCCKTSCIFLLPVFQYVYDQYYHFTTQSFQFKDILESIVPKLSRL